MTTASESPQKEFNPRDDAKLESDDIQDLIDEIDGNLMDTAAVGSINRKKKEPNQGNQRKGSTTDNEMRSRTASDASQADSVLDEGNRR